MIKRFDVVIRLAASSGMSLQETASCIGCRYQSVYRYAQKQGIAFGHGNRIRCSVPDERALKMKAAYESGKTLEEIGTEHSVTRERVRQIITKFWGRMSADYGAALKAKASRAERERAKEARAQKKWGCTWAQYVKVRKLTRDMLDRGAAECETPLKAFYTQRANARTRGIAWEFTFWEWWTLWQKSGKWDRRGRGRSAFVMCRKGNAGPYSPSNVIIAPAFQNIHEANNKSGLPAGVQEMSSGKYQAFMTVNKQRILLGTFSTPEQAHLAYLKNLSLEAA